MAGTITGYPFVILLFIFFFTFNFTFIFTFIFFYIRFLKINQFMYMVLQALKKLNSL